MSGLDLERIDAQQVQFKAELAKRGASPLAALLTLSEAARMLAITVPALRELIAANVVLTMTRRGRELVPRSEVDRLLPADPAKLTIRRKRSAPRELAKVRAPYEGARAILLRVRAAKRQR